MSDLRGPVRALFSDVDGTMTTGERIDAATFAALERLGESGIPVVMVTGRSAGFGDACIRMLPVLAVVAENGGVTFVRDGHRITKSYGVPASTIPEWRRRMMVAIADVMADVPGVQLSGESVYREVDLAIDWNEEVSLPVTDAERCVEILRGAGVIAVRSSGHGHCSP
ncbi:MAG: HAD family hydrolase, partial [Kofleriaceae bacterium]